MKQMLQAHAAQLSATIDGLPEDVFSDMFARIRIREQIAGLIDATEPPSVFFRLPPEIRGQIYELCLVAPKFLWLPRDAQTSKSYRYQSEISPVSLPLLAVNKQIRYETLPILFGKNNWRMNMGMILVDDTPENDRSQRVTTTDKSSFRCFPMLKQINSFLDKYGSLIRFVTFWWSYDGAQPRDIELLAHNWALQNNLPHWPREQAKTALLQSVISAEACYAGFLSKMTGLKRVTVEVRRWSGGGPGSDSYRMVILEQAVKKILTRQRDIRQVQLKMYHPLNEDEKGLLTRWRRQGLANGKTKLVFATKDSGTFDLYSLDLDFPFQWYY